MDQKSQLLLQKIDSKLEAMFEELTQFSEEQLQKSPTEDAWSVMQVMHHLKLVEFHANAYVKKKLSFDPQLPKIDFQSKMRSVFMDFLMKSPFRREAPKAVNDQNFPKDVSFVQLKEQWLAQRTDLKNHLESLDEALFQKQVYKHPFAGRLSLTGMLSFFDSHFERHYRQIKRTLKQVV